MAFLPTAPAATHNRSSAVHRRSQFCNVYERLANLTLLWRLNRVAHDSKNLRENIVLAHSNRIPISRVLCGIASCGLVRWKCREISMAKRYNFLTRCLAAVALLFIYAVSTSAILIGASTTPAKAWRGRGGFYRGGGWGRGRGWGYRGYYAPAADYGYGARSHWSYRWG